MGKGNLMFDWKVGQLDKGKQSAPIWNGPGDVLDLGPTLFQNTCPSHHCRGLKSRSSSLWCLLTFSVQLDEFVPLWKGQRLDCPIEDRILHLCIFTRNLAFYKVYISL